MTTGGDGPTPSDYDRVALGDLTTRYVHHLIGDLDPPAPDRKDRSPRSVALERLALGAAIAGRAQAGWAIDAAAAVGAGASWEQVARASGQDVPALRAQFAARVRGQTQLHQATGIGLRPGDAARAWRLLDPPAADPGRYLGRGLDGPGR